MVYNKKPFIEYLKALGMNNWLDFLTLETSLKSFYCINRCSDSQYLRNRSRHRCRKPKHPRIIAVIMYFRCSLVISTYEI